MIGRYLFGIISGGVLALAALVVGSAMFPTEQPNAVADPESRPVVDVSTGAVPESEPESGPEPEPESSTVPEPEATADPATDAEAESAADVTEEVADDGGLAAEANAPITGESATTDAVDPAPTGNPVTAEVEPTTPAQPEPQALAEAPTSNDPPTSDPPATDPPATDPPVEPEAPEVPSVAEVATETASEAPVLAEVAEPVTPLAPLPLPKLDFDAVLSALDKAAVPQAAPDAAPEPAAAPTEPELAEPEFADASPEAVPEAYSPEAPSVESAMDEGVSPDSPSPDSDEEMAEVTPDPEPAPEPGQTDAAETEMAGLPETDLPDADLPDAEPPEFAETLPEALPDPAESDEQPEADIALLPEDEDEEESASTFRPATRLGERAEGVIVGRLPRIGDEPAPAAEADLADEATGEDPDDARPIALYAAAFDNPDGKPRVAIVLIDLGNEDLDRDSLAALPFPISIALDPLDPATPERAATYRAGGKEVVMQATGIAEGAQASDIEVAFQSMAQGLPEAVAVMDLPQPVFQHRRPLASLVVPVVGAQGRGLLTWNQGLNAADQVARREDIAAAVVFRDLASAGPDRASIRLVLDRAVFKAGQDGRVAIAGEASPEVVAALLEWAIEGRAATVALAPLTAVLTID